MSAFSRSIAILVFTLIVGALVGAALTGVIIRHRLEGLRAFTTAEGFSPQFIDVLEPLTEEQRKKVEPLVSAAGKDIQAVVKLTRLELFLIIERLEEDLHPHLTKEQRKQLQQQREATRRRFKGPPQSQQ